MRTEVITALVLIVTIIFAGCVSQTDTGDQDSGADSDQQVPSGDGGQGLDQTQPPVTGAGQDTGKKPSAASFALKSTGQWTASSPTGIAIDNSGNVYVVEHPPEGGAMVKYDSNGKELLKITGGSKVNERGDDYIRGPDGLIVIFPPSNPIDIAVDSKGNIYVADKDGNDYDKNVIEKFDASGNLLTKLQIATENYYSTNPSSYWPVILGIAVDSKDNVYAIIYLYEGGSWIVKVKVFSPSGQEISTWQTGAYQTSHIGIDSADAVYVASSDEILIYGTSGNLIKKITEDEYLVFAEPNGIAIDSSGNIYVVEFQRSDIKFFNNAGSRIGVLGGFTTPIDVAVDKDGNVYVTDRGANLIQKYK